MLLEIILGFIIASVIYWYDFIYNPRRPPPPPVRYNHIGKCDVCGLINCHRQNCNIIRDLDPSTMDTIIVIIIYDVIKQELIDYVTYNHGLECFVGKYRHKAGLALDHVNCLIIRPPTGSMTKYAGKE